MSKLLSYSSEYLQVFHTFRVEVEMSADQCYFPDSYYSKTRQHPRSRHQFYVFNLICGLSQQYLGINMSEIDLFFSIATTLFHKTTLTI